MRLPSHACRFQRSLQSKTSRPKLLYSNEYVVSYWAVKQVFDSRLVNVRKDLKSVSIKVGSETSQVNVPIFINISKITAGDELFVLKAGDAEPLTIEPPSKVARKGSKGGGKTGKR